MPIDVSKVVWDSDIDKTKIVWDDDSGDEKAVSRHQSGKQPTATGYMRGVRDPLDAGAQLLEKVLPDSVSKKVNQFNNWLVDKGLPLQRMPEGGFDQFIKEDEAAYQAQRQAKGDTGIDWPRLGGNIVNPANIAIASSIPAATGAIARTAPILAPVNSALGQAVTGGAVMGMAQPVTQGDYWTEKGKQAGVGAISGGVTNLAASGLARVIKPKSSPEVQALLKEGVTPTPGQALGGLAKTTEEKMSSLPIVGDAIRAGQKRGVDQFNRAVMDRALAPLSKKLPKDVPVGREALNYVDDVVSKEYNELLPKLGGKLDRQFMKEVNGLKSLAQSMPADKADQLNRILDREVIGRFTQSGLANGHTLKDIESKLGSMAKGYMRSSDYDQRTLGSALRETQEALRKMLERNNPKHRGQLKSVNKAYAHYKRAERAMSYVGADDGVFTPAQFNSAVKALDVSKDKKLFAKGKAFDQDFAAAGKNVLGGKYPDSGTAGRLMLNAAAVGGVVGGATSVSPYALGAAGLGVLPYMPGFQRAATNFLANGPLFSQSLSDKIAAPIADSIRKGSPLLIPATAPMTYGLLGSGN